MRAKVLLRRLSSGYGLVCSYVYLIAYGSTSSASNGRKRLDPTFEECTARELSNIAAREALSAGGTMSLQLSARSSP